MKNSQGKLREGFFQYINSLQNSFTGNSTTIKEVGEELMLFFKHFMLSNCFAGLLDASNIVVSFCCLLKW